MVDSIEERSAQLVRNIDRALAKFPTLTGKQLEDVRRLRTELIELSSSGHLDEAKRCEKLALMIIRQGAPNPE